MKRVLIIVAITVGILIVCGVGVLCAKQYNWKGASNYLIIEVDDSGLTDVWGNQQVRVMTYNLKMPNVECWNGKVITLKNALQQKKISVDQLCDKAEREEDVQWNGEQARAYIYENYQVVVCPQNIYYIAPKGAFIEK